MRTTILLTIICVLSSTTLLQVATCSDKEKVLKVTIVTNYTAPQYFNFKPPSFRAGSSLTLSCEVEGAENDNSGLLYEWKSSCSGNCFVRGGIQKSVSTQYLRSLDNGVHTCIVHDRGGCTGNASITVMIKGAGIFVESPRNEDLPNNSLIVETGRYFARIPQFRGLSASNRSYVGQLIDPQGRDITASTTDPFIVSLGSSFEPGTMRVRCFRSLQRSEVGIYTYRTPDETGKITDVNFGLYTSNSSQPPVVTNLSVSLGKSLHFVLNCSSYYSPPTQVIWRKDGQQINISADGYEMSQFLVDRVSSSYVSTLSKDGVLDDVVGEYSCTVTNTLGTSNTRNVTVEPVTITGHESPIIVGRSGVINCSTIHNASKIEWRLVGIGAGEPVEEADWKQSLALTLTPEATELNGAKLTCRVTTAKRLTFEKTVTVTIKELDNIVTIEDSSNGTLVGGKAIYTCVVTSDFIPTVQWLDKNNNSITSSGDLFWVEKQYTIRKTTYLKLVFDPIRTSHGGSYTCKSVIHEFSSTNSTTRNIFIKLAQESVYVEKSPSSNNYYTGQSLTLTCWTLLNNTVDTSILVSHIWTGPGGTISTDSRRNLTQVSIEGSKHVSTLTISSLRTSDSGTYYCQSTSQPSLSLSLHSYISPSDPKRASTTLNALINVTITINYTSPDPGYSPPNYRAASGVTLTCRAVGVSGSVSYRWSSTCSSCFASSRSSSSISKTFLVARDAGTHTCTVTDSSGDRGSNRTTMNIVGSGIYVEISRGTGTGLNSGAQPNNSYALVDTGSGRQSTRFQMYCCSSSRYSTVYLTYPSGYKISSGSYSSYNRVTSYSSSDSYAGCARFYYSRSSYRSFYLSYPGIYTCSSGNEFSSIALYSETSSIRTLYLTSLQRVAWSSHSPASLIIRTSTYYSPPSNITWYRNNEPIDTKQSNISAMAYITHRRSIYYKLELTIRGTPEDVVGHYSIRVANSRGTSTRTLSSNITGAEITCNSTKFVIGEVVRCTCTSDLNPTRVQWYKGNDSLSCSNSTRRYGQIIYGPSSADVIPSADDHGKELTCETDTPYGTQRVFIEMEVEVPDTWGVITMESSTETPLHNNNYSITCQLVVNPGMNLQVLIQWLSHNGSVITSQDNRTIENRNTTDILRLQSSVCHGPAHQNTFQHSMAYDPISNSDGGSYSCQASVSVPWMRLQPPKLKRQISISVTTQAKFQLKVYPVTHCSTWDMDKAQALDRSVKMNLEKGISSLCNCSFNSTRIHSSEFSCQPKSCSSDESCGPSSSAVSPVTYRAVVNGSSDFLTADQIINYIDMWREDTGTLLHEMFRLRVYSKKECDLKIDSFNEREC